LVTTSSRGLPSILHRKITVGLVEESYDAAGNRLKNNTNAYTWDPNGPVPLLATESATSTAYIYGAGLIFREGRHHPLLLREGPHRLGRERTGGLGLGQRDLEDRLHLRPLGRDPLAVGNHTDQPDDLRCGVPGRLDRERQPLELGVGVPPEWFEPKVWRAAVLGEEVDGPRAYPFDEQRDLLIRRFGVHVPRGPRSPRPDDPKASSQARISLIRNPS
jgi:hypothetical protein